MTVGLIGINPVAGLAIEIGNVNNKTIEFILIDDNLKRHGTFFKGLEIVAAVPDLMKGKVTLDGFAVCFGEKLLAQKKSTYLNLKEMGCKPINFIHHSVSYFVSTVIGSGNVIGAGVVLGHESIIEDNCIVFGGAVIEHNTRLGSHCYVGPNSTVSGFCDIQEGTLIGSGATILPEIKIGKFCKIGAGAVVTKNVADYSVVYGVPAREVKKAS